MSQEATQYLLADLALYSNDYQGALDDGNKVLSKSNDIYFTSEGLNSLWSKNTYSGRIFAFNNNSSYYAGIQYSSQEGDYFMVNPQLSFVGSDLRKALFVYPFMMNGSNRELLGKYNRCNKQISQRVTSIRCGMLELILLLLRHIAEREIQRLLVD